MSLMQGRRSALAAVAFKYTTKRAAGTPLQRRPEDATAPSVGPCVRCSRCGKLGATAVPNWIERYASVSTTRMWGPYIISVRSTYFRPVATGSPRCKIGWWNNRAIPVFGVTRTTPPVEVQLWLIVNDVASPSKSSFK